jgi:hypothetical protein
MRHKTRTRPFLFDDTSLDAAICAGEASWPGTDASAEGTEPHGGLGCRIKSGMTADSVVIAGSTRSSVPPSMR